MDLKGTLVLMLVFGDCQVPILQFPVCFFFFVIERKDSFESNISVQVLFLYNCSFTASV